MGLGLKLGVGVEGGKVWVPLASALGQGQHGGTAQYYYKRRSKRSDSEPRQCMTRQPQPCHRGNKTRLYGSKKKTKRPIPALPLNVQPVFVAHVHPHVPRTPFGEAVAQQRQDEPPQHSAPQHSAVDADAPSPRSSSCGAARRPPRPGAQLFSSPSSSFLAQPTNDAKGE